MKQFIADRHTTPGTPAMDPIGEPAIPLYPTEQDLLDDLANLEVGQIAGTIDPAESELIGVLIQKIQALENKLDSDDVYSTDEVKTNKTWIDGKSIYRKVYRGITSGQSIGISDIYEVVNIKAIASARLGYRYYMLMPWAVNGNETAVCVSSDFKWLLINKDSPVNGACISVILEYTKTTD